MRTAIVVLMMWVLAGCGEEAPMAGPTTSLGGDGGTSKVCMDLDGDGFGANCLAGPDCDDEDAEDTDLCYRCAQPHEDCPCEPATPPEWCNPPDEHVEGGLIVCSEGTRYCRDGFWSDCERIEAYAMFVSN